MSAAELLRNDSSVRPTCFLNLHPLKLRKDSNQPHDPTFAPCPCYNPPTASRPAAPCFALRCLASPCPLVYETPPNLSGSQAYHSVIFNPPPPFLNPSHITAKLDNPTTI